MIAIKANVVLASIALFAAASPLIACSVGAASVDPDPPAVQPPPAPAKGVIVGDFVAHLSPHDGSITFYRTRRAAAKPGFHAQDLNDPGDTLIIDNDGAEGSGSTNTVELVTNSVNFNGGCPAGYQANSFCGNVTLRHFYGRSLSDVFVQVTGVTDAQGNPLSDHGGLNNAPGEHGLDDSWGLWKYTGQGVTTAGVLGQHSPFNAGSADWVFSNPDDADTWIYLRVVAALSYSDYTAGASSTSFIDACAIGGSTTSSSATQPMPFPFTFWDTTSSTVAFNKLGMVTFGDTPGSANGLNECLPSGTAPTPGLFAFWDDLTFGPTGKMCWATVGAEPNRRFVIEWSDMDFATDDGPVEDVGSSLTFEAILSEGTNQIELSYGEMRAPSGSSSNRPAGSSATVGIQNSTSTAAPGAACDSAKFVSGSSFAFGPVP
jgi:hypothetical protein